MDKFYLQIARNLRLRGWGDAEQQMCSGIAALGRLAGIDVDMGRGPGDIDTLLIEAAYQSNFNDAEFLGGPCCFGFVETVVDVDILKLQADTVAQGLADYIRGRAEAASIREAEAQLALIDAAFAWLRKARQTARHWPEWGHETIPGRLTRRR
ncbi:hypothetical protein GJV26_04325 [Massilia dura]|uniref:Uncharacterized protein n=1 Tax=Pseudoduganella dura TaxID=321982 RepID=A0A6I3XC81_9BURK|nr:hypothetical protein [Pseudoduganella dura]MUI11713.1 hypothetical protein [Pseudoduganella dura]GGX78515.1 hypothetical protein GCM10007386_06910 [Pseudoduganella dura]